MGIISTYSLFDKAEGRHETNASIVGKIFRDNGIPVTDMDLILF